VLGNEVNVTLDTQWGGFKTVRGEGGFILRTEGQGTVVCVLRALEVWNLEAGQSITIDTGHMVAYEDTIQMAMRKASGGGLVQSFQEWRGLRIRLHRSWSCVDANAQPERVDGLDPKLRGHR